MSSLTDTPVALAARRAGRRSGALAYAGLAALVFAAVLGGIFVWQVSVLAPPAPQEVKATDVVAKPDQISSEDATISGRDKNERPYTIHAKSGEQDKALPHIVHMNDVTSTFQRPDGVALDVVSKSGVFDRKSKALELSGAVRFTENGRFQATMEKATLNTNDQTLVSRSPVKVDMHGTMIEAGSLVVTENGTHILFKGGVKARFKTD